MPMRLIPIIARVAIVAASISTSVSTIRAQALPRSVPTQSVITTLQKVSPAGTQTAFDARVYGVGFGSSSDEVWVLVGAPSGGPARLYELSWRDNSVRAARALAGSPAPQGLFVDVANDIPYVSQLARVSATPNRAATGGASRTMVN